MVFKRSSRNVLQFIYTRSTKWSASVFAGLLLLGCQPTTTDTTTTSCVAFSANLFNQINDISFEFSFPAGSCVGAVLDSNSNLYGTSPITFRSDAPAEVSVAGTALTSSVLPQHLEAGFSVTNVGTETICSLSFDSLWFMDAEQEIIFSAGPVGVITALYDPIDGNPGFCLAPGDSGWARKSAYGENEIGDLSIISNITLGTFNYAPLPEDQSVYEDPDPETDLFQPLELTYTGSELTTEILYSGTETTLLPDRVIAIYTDTTGNFLDYDQWPAHDDVVVTQNIEPGESFIARFRVEESQSPRGKAFGALFIVIQ